MTYNSPSTRAVKVYWKTACGDQALIKYFPADCIQASNAGRNGHTPVGIRLTST
ncbi:8003_t:CDS:2 [Funneliformis caledonium]|uniref:8003_t:CDS:1 n=1 Tax=Funneliformis caledonium TaxID=1117310 RepID=A0A9N9GCH9_9GLOM|nr:8003_t:CDS:2 [Funneliformis caledonium]